MNVSINLNDNKDWYVNKIRDLNLEIANDNFFEMLDIIVIEYNNFLIKSYGHALDEILYALHNATIEEINNVLEDFSPVPAVKLIVTDDLLCLNDSERLQFCIGSRLWTLEELGNLRKLFKKFEENFPDDLKEIKALGTICRNRQEIGEYLSKFSNYLEAKGFNCYFNVYPNYGCAGMGFDYLKALSFDIDIVSNRAK